MSKITLNENAALIWKHLDENGPVEVGALAQALKIDQSQVVVVAGEGQVLGMINIQEATRLELSLTPQALEILTQGLAERKAIELLAKQADFCLAMPEFLEQAKTLGIAVNEVFRWGAQKNWIAREKEGGGRVRLLDAGQKALDTLSDDEKALKIVLAKNAPIYLDEIADQIDTAWALPFLEGRKEISRIKERKERIVSLTAEGKTTWSSGLVQVKKEKNALTPEDIKSGAWRDIVLRPYDVTLASSELYPAKLHPVRKIIEQTRQAFLELGFEEVASPSVEVAFWNFDALFQPQDHPARDMQDTFYMADPSRASLPNANRVEAVKRSHETGEGYQSTGWGYRWKASEAEKTVLRTHTTASTIRALARNPDAPYKAFCVGWTYRNESISYKHLPVFHQVDGLVIDKDANLSSLLGILSAFYQKMGFSKVRFKPAFYPYTEPSVDVMVYMESRGKWIEMGGSGIFRPEVTEPLGCKHPVLAWGLGIERLAMIRLGFDDIRHLYQGGLDTIEGVPLCR
jgi:phenylalanyl-tRNA synthetase alpha chain